MNNIKKLIGQRILLERKAKGLTQAKLAELAGGFKQPRINNWEQGIRTPGPEEIKQLAKVLDVSPAFLMCLTDRKQPHASDKNYVGALIPLLHSELLHEPQRWTQSIQEGEYDGEIKLIPITIELAKVIGDNGFALKMNDESMEPELKPGDILIINPDATPKPSNFVVVTSDDNPDVIIRRYKQLSISKSIQQFELLATNKNWPDIQSHELVGCKILGTVFSLSRQIA